MFGSILKLFSIHLKMIWAAANELKPFSILKCPFLVAIGNALVSAQADVGSRKRLIGNFEISIFGSNWKFLIPSQDDTGSRNLFDKMPIFGSNWKCLGFCSG